MTPPAQAGSSAQTIMQLVPILLIIVLFQGVGPGGHGRRPCWNGRGDPGPAG